MLPTIGRIVIYNHPDTDGGPLTKSPALVQAVYPDRAGIDLVVFGPAWWGMNWKMDAQQGDGPGQWNWPPRV